MPIEIATADDIKDLKKLVEYLNDHVNDLTQMLAAQVQSQLPEWLTVQESADFLRVKPATIRRKVQAGHFQTRRDGKKILISRESVLDQSNR